MTSLRRLLEIKIHKNNRFRRLTSPWKVRHTSSKNRAQCSPTWVSLRTWRQCWWRWSTPSKERTRRPKDKKMRRTWWRARNREAKTRKMRKDSTKISLKKPYKKSGKWRRANTTRMRIWNKCTKNINKPLVASRGPKISTRKAKWNTNNFWQTWNQKEPKDHRKPSKINCSTCRES